MSTRGRYMSSGEEIRETRRQYHSFTFVAFILALLVLVFPIQFFVVGAALRNHHAGRALAAMVISLIAVVAPLVFAQVQTRLHPDRWKWRFLTRLVWCIVFLNVLFNVFLFTNAMGMRPVGHRVLETNGTEAVPHP